MTLSTPPAPPRRSLRAALLLLLVVLLAGLAPAPAQAAGGQARIARLKAAVKTAQAASLQARDALTIAQGEAAPYLDRGAQAARRADAADAGVVATGAAARDAAAGLQASQAAQDAARASAAAAEDRARAAESAVVGAQQGAASATQAQQQAQQGLDAADNAVQAAQGDLDREKARWFSCTQSSGRFTCRRSKNDDYVAVPRLDQLLERRVAAQQVKDARSHELASATQAAGEWAGRVQQATATAVDAQAVAGSAAAARDRAQAAQAAAAAKRDETAAASARAASEATAARAAADAAQVDVHRVQAGLDLLRDRAQAASSTLTRAKQHLRYVKRQLARRR